MIHDPTILDDLRDLHKQATAERSHYYTGSVIERSIKVITRQNAALAECHKEIFKLRDALLALATNPPPDGAASPRSGS